MLDYRETYSWMSDAQLLDLAPERSALLPEAQTAYDAELALRRFGPAEISKRVEERHAAEIEIKGQPPLAWNIGMFGTDLLGAKDFEPDGSFLTTKWIVLFWVPIVPLKSLRIRYVGPRGRAVRFAGASAGHVVCSERPVDIWQVAFTYAFIALFFVGRAILARHHASDVVTYCALGAFIFLVMAPRWLAKRTAMRAS